MKRAILIIVGVLVLLLGLGATVAGAGIAAAVGSDGKFDSAAGTASSQGYALVFNQFEVTGTGQETIMRFADMTVGAHSANGKELFIGLAPAPAVASYLAGAPHDVVTDVASGRAVTIPGDTAPKPSAKEKFWTSQAVGLDPVVKLTDTAVPQTLVVMNAEPSTGVSIVLRIGVASGSLFPVGIGLAVLGLLVIVLAVWIFVRAAKAKRRPQLPPGGGYQSVGIGYAQPPGQYPQGAGYGSYPQPPPGYQQQPPPQPGQYPPPSG